MVDGLAFLQCPQSTDAPSALKQRLPWKVPTAHQEQFGVQYLAKGHLDMQVGGARIHTSHLSVAKRLALPPELHPLCLTFNHSQVRSRFSITVVESRFAWQHER